MKDKPTCFCDRMVSRRNPPNQRREMAAVVAAPPRLDPTLLRDAAKMVDKCMARLQELQYTLAGGKKVTTSAGLTPTPTTSPTNFRTKQESLKIKIGNSRRISPSEKLPTNTTDDDHEEEWRVGETVGEIVDAPEMVVRKNQKEKITMEHSSQLLGARRKTEKEVVVQVQPTQTSSSSSRSCLSFQRANKSGKDDHLKKKKKKKKKKKTEFHHEVSENSRSHAVNRVCPRNRPWARKAVLFPNPLFQSSPDDPPPVVVAAASNKSQKRGAAAMLKRSFSPANLKKSFSPSRLVSPLKGVRSMHKKGAQNVN